MIALLDGSCQLDLLVRAANMLDPSRISPQISNGSDVSAKTAHGGAHRSRRGAAARDCQ